MEIIHETEDYLVIVKPAGLLTHPVREGYTEPTLVDQLLAHAPHIADVGEHTLRPGIVHRLDKHVSGLMVIAKTPAMFTCLKTQFQERTIKKIYLALVYGSLNKEEGSINFLIARSKSTGKMVARPVSQEGRLALTHYSVLDRFATTTYVRVQIHTGRTHQIRVHFLAIDHPLVGDTLYTKKHMKHVRRLEMDRIFLHAHELTFSDLLGERCTFRSNLPDDLQTILDTQTRV